MDTEEDAEEYGAMDFSEPNARFADAALELIRDVPEPLVLDIGTGTAEIPLLMLARHPRVRIVAVDMADSMLRYAKRLADARGYAERLELRRLDAKALDLPDAHFDLVMSNSLVHHIPEPSTVFCEIARVVRKHGAILVRDLFRPESREIASEMVDRVVNEASEKQRGLFFDSLCAALTLDEVRELVTRARLDDLEISIISDRHWTAQRPATLG
jgi:ubiquinone/menaquinone biosynthesis C-methylase UbiE